MSTDRDDRWGEELPEPEPDRAAAAARVRTPANLMIACGVLLLLWAAFNVAVVASGYDLNPAILEWAAEQQPPGKARDDLKKEAEKAKTRDRTVEYVQTAIFTAIGVGMDVLILLAGVRMRQLRSYTLCLIGSIITIVPLNSCCCLAMPIGIWALVVLSKPDVKAAFAGGRRRPARRDEFDERP